MSEVLDVSSILPQKFEPKMRHRWVLALEGVDQFLLKTAQRPKYTIPKTAIPFINSVRYVAGRVTVGEITITLHDPIAPSASQQIMEWMRLHTEHVSGRAGYANFYKRDLQLKLLDPIGVVVELWDMKGCQLTGELNFGDLSYEEEAALNELSLVIQPDLAVLQF